MPRVLVGGSPCPVSWREFAVALMTKGEPVEFWTDGLGEGKKHGVGLFDGSSFYDGITGFVDCYGKRVMVFPGAKGHKIKRWKPSSEFSNPCAQGDGI